MFLASFVNQYISQVFQRHAFFALSLTWNRTGIVFRSWWIWMKWWETLAWASCWSLERTHGSLEQSRIGTQALGHSLFSLLVCSYHSLIYVRCSAHFARTLDFAYSLARSLAHSLTSDAWKRDQCASLYSLFSTHLPIFFSSRDVTMNRWSPKKEGNEKLFSKHPPP